MKPPRGLEAAQGHVAGHRVLVLSWDMDQAADRHAVWPKLTPAQREIVPLLLAGMTNAQIAAARGTSRHTVARQVSALFERLGVTSRAELAALIR